MNFIYIKTIDTETEYLIDINTITKISAVKNDIQYMITVYADDGYGTRYSISEKNWKEIVRELRK